MKPFKSDQFISISLSLFKTKKFKITVFMLIAALAAIIWGRQFVALASELIDSFTDTTRVSDTWNVQVDTAAGEVKLAARTCDSNVWICGAANVCVNSFGDGEYILVASTTISGTKQWKTANTACELPQCGQAGGQDGDNFDADNTINYVSYPARQACKDMGGRLPTQAELSCIYSNRTSFNNNFGTDDYWSSTEISETNARFIDFSTGYSSNNDKTTAYSVRCVRGW